MIYCNFNDVVKLYLMWIMFDFGERIFEREWIVDGKLCLILCRSEYVLCFDFCVLFKFVFLGGCCGNDVKKIVIGGWVWVWVFVIDV